jgi:hypothetical protein
MTGRWDSHLFLIIPFIIGRLVELMLGVGLPWHAEGAMPCDLPGHTAETRGDRRPE